MEGEAVLTFTNRDESYTLSQPNMYARGILFGTMRMELGDHSTVRCEKTDLIADIEFKTKGFIGGKYDTIHGIIRRESSSEKLFEIEGKWNEKMTIKDLKTKKSSTFFDGSVAKETLITTKPISEMAENESRRLWHSTTEAIKARDQTAATNAKSEIEDAQRDLAKTRQENNETWEPKFFTKVGPEDYLFKAPKDLDGAKVKELMEDMCGGITATRTPTVNTPTPTTKSVPSTTPRPATETVTSHNTDPAPPRPGDVPRPALHPVDSENQTFVDAAESFDGLSIHNT